MDELIWQERPQVERPALVVALGGWSDAGEVGTWSANWIQRHYQAQAVASLPGDDFFVLSQQRPLVQLDPEGQRIITWPGYQFTRARVPGGRDLIILTGPEPHLRWKTFSAAVLEVVEALDIKVMVSLGGLAGMVLHSAPPRVTGSANTLDLTRRLGPVASVSRYQGPVGLLSVLVVACRDAGLGTASLWGNVPHYLQASPNIKVGVGLLEMAGHLLEVPFDLREARARASRFDTEVAAAIAQDPAASRYVRQLEEQLRAQTPFGAPPPTERGEELPSSENIIADLEDFLRQQRGEQE